MAMEAEVREKPKEKESTEACTVAEAIAAIEKSGKMDASLKAAYHSKTEMVELAGKLNKWVGVNEAERLRERIKNPESAKELYETARRKWCS
jgi:hypothetical protein